jgi:hypothetical protein
MVIRGYLPAVLFAETFVTSPEIAAVRTKQGAGLIEIQSQTITESDTGFLTGIVAAISIGIHRNVTGRTKNCDGAAGAIMGLGNLGSPTIAVIAVGNAVTSTDRVPNIRTSLGDDHAPAKVVGEIAGAGREFAELVGPVTGDPRKSAADLRALALTGNVHAGRGGVTRIAVGIPVTAADRVIDLGTGLRSRLATACTIITDTHAFSTVLVVCRTIGVTLARCSAGPVMVLGNKRHLPFAIIAIGHAIATADRIPDSQAGIGNNRASAKVVGKIAGAGRIFTELVRPVTGDPDKPAADLGALAVAGDVHSRRRCLTGVVVSIAVTAANRVIYLRAYLRLHFTCSGLIVTDAGILSAIFSAAAFTIVLANLHAGPVMLLGNVSHLAFAVVAIGHTIAATHRIPYQGAGVGRFDADALVISDIAGSRRKLAEIIQAGATDPGDSSADIL